MDTNELSGRDRLRIAIDHSGLTDGEAADKCQIPRAYLSGILNKKRVAQPDEIAAFERHFAVPAESWVRT